MSLILFRFACLQCLVATHSSSPEIGNGLSWPKPYKVHMLDTSQAQYSTNEVHSTTTGARANVVLLIYLITYLLRYSTCSILMSESDDLRLS